MGVRAQTRRLHDVSRTGRGSQQYPASFSSTAHTGRPALLRQRARTSAVAPLKQVAREKGPWSGFDCYNAERIVEIDITAVGRVAGSYQRVTDHGIAFRHGAGEAGISTTIHRAGIVELVGARLAFSDACGGRWPSYLGRRGEA